MKTPSKIGTLTYRADEECWIATFATDAFKQFRFRWDQRNYGFRSIDIRFLNLSESEAPGKRLISFASKLINNVEKLAPKIGSAAWEFFMSKYSDDIADVVEFAYKPRKPPSVRFKDDIGLLLGCPDLEIVQEDRTIFARFSFACGWDIEHGLGICSNGSRVTGIGDSIMVCPGDNCG